MTINQTLEVPVKGMDCAECTQHVQRAISRLDGVASVDVLLATEKAIIRLDPDKVTLADIRRAVASAGEYSVPETTQVMVFQERLFQKDGQGDFDTIPDDFRLSLVEIEGNLGQRVRKLFGGAEGDDFDVTIGHLSSLHKRVD